MSNAVILTGCLRSPSKTRFFATRHPEVLRRISNFKRFSQNRDPSEYLRACVRSPLSSRLASLSSRGTPRDLGISGGFRGPEIPRRANIYLTHQGRDLWWSNRKQRRLLGPLRRFRFEFLFLTFP